MANPALAKTRRFDTVAVMFSLSANKRVIEALAELGRITLLAKEAVLSLLKGRASWRDLLYQIYFIGVKSQSVVLITGAFTGMVLGRITLLAKEAVLSLLKGRASLASKVI